MKGVFNDGNRAVDLENSKIGVGKSLNRGKKSRLRRFLSLSHCHNMLSRDGKMLSRSRKMLLRGREMLSRDRKMLSRGRKIRSRDCKMLSHGRKMLSRGRKILPRGRKMLSRYRKMLPRYYKMRVILGILRCGRRKRGNRGGVLGGGNKMERERYYGL